MISISVADIQKNISLLTKMTDIIEVVDKRRKIKVAKFTQQIIQIL